MTRCPAANDRGPKSTKWHAHLIYGLDVPVRTVPDVKSAPLRYAAAVGVLRAVLGADEG